jgi:hypothetical protein
MEVTKMNLYKIIYRLVDGAEGEEIVCAANRMMAFMVFEDFGYANVVAADCFRVLDEEEEN